MAGRSNSDDRRAQASKKGPSRRDFKRISAGYKQKIGTGRGRTSEPVRDRNFKRLHDHQLADLANTEQFGRQEERLEDRADLEKLGAELNGIKTHATVLEVRKGNFLAELKTLPEMPMDSKPLPKVIRVVARGLMQHFDLGLSSLVVAGDEVELIVPPVKGPDDYEAILTKVLERRSLFRRLHPTGRAIQTLAANLDQVAIIASSREPHFRPGFIDRVHACTLACGLPCLLVLNKVDLGIDEETRELLNIYTDLGLPSIETCSLDGLGIAALIEQLRGKRTVFCGHSGVGKSSLLTALAPQIQENVRVGEISRQTQKGRHTTTHARLFRLDFGEVIDTPGVREFTPADTTRQNLWAWFPEIARLNGQCTYSNCSHCVEEGCAVLNAVEEGFIHPRRHESYFRIYQSLPT